MATAITFRLVCGRAFFVEKTFAHERIAYAGEETFLQYLLRYMNERGTDPVEVYKRAHLNRRFLSKLRTNRKYKPHKHTLLAIAFELELAADEAEILLNRYGCKILCG